MSSVEKLGEGGWGQGVFCWLWRGHQLWYCSGSPLPVWKWSPEIQTLNGNGRHTNKYNNYYVNVHVRLCAYYARFGRGRPCALKIKGPAGKTRGRNVLTTSSGMFLINQLRGDACKKSIKAIMLYSVHTLQENHNM